MGVVLQAEDHNLSREAAIQVLRGSGFGSAIKNYGTARVREISSFLAWSLALLLMGSALALAQSEVPVFKVETNLQSIAVRVTDKQGNDVQGLSAEDFTLLEDGRPQKIAFFGVEYEPLSLTILIDSSNSMESGGKLDRARTVFGPLIRGNHPEDEVSLLPFTDQVGRIQSLTSEQRLDPPRTRVSMRTGGTALYDALASALCHMRSARHPRQAIVVMTDGADQHSRLRLEQLIELARSSNPQIFMIGFYDKSEYEVYRQRSKTVTLVSGREIDNPLIAFGRLAEESGAESFFPTSDRDLQHVLDRISAVLQAQYTLAYYPPSVASVRTIQVKVRRRGVKVEARSHVGSGAGEGALRFTASCEISANEHPYPWESRVSQSPSKTTVYREDFSDPTSGWPNRDGSRYRPEGYVISRSVSPDTITTGPVAEGRIAAYGPWWEGFRASVLVDANWQRTRGSGIGLHATTAGMVFHLNEGGYYALLLSGSDRGKTMAFKFVRHVFWEGREYVITPWTKLSTPSMPGPTGRTQHKITVESDQGLIQVAVDDQRLGPFRDDTFTDGLVGFAVFGNSRAVFRDLVVEGLP